MQGWPGGQQLSGCLHGAQVANMPFAFQAMSADGAEEQEPSSKRQRSQDGSEAFPCLGGWPGSFGDGCGGSCGSGYGGASSSGSGAGALDPMAGCGGCSGLGWGACGGMNPIQLAQMQQMAQAMAAFASNAKEDFVPENPNVEERYYGVIRDYNESQGFGFIECEDAKWRYGMDVFIHRRQMFGLAKGDEVSFVIVRNSQGQPQARHVIKKEETARILEKRKDREKREAEKLQAKKQASEKVFTPSTMEGKVMSEEEARRFQKSLKRGR
mmetsp:Transcript_39143/g.80144  ORF Transcript_39143/g.80144 Transcript_39143/m.80144 type:complete len:269 (+) Transcript_39143:60-866(+)